MSYSESHVNRCISGITDAERARRCRLLPRLADRIAEADSAYRVLLAVRDAVRTGQQPTVRGLATAARVPHRTAEAALARLVRAELVAVTHTADPRTGWRAPSQYAVAHADAPLSLLAAAARAGVGRGPARLLAAAAPSLDVATGVLAGWTPARWQEELGLSRSAVYAALASAALVRTDNGGFRCVAWDALLVRPDSSGLGPEFGGLGTAAVQNLAARRPELAAVSGQSCPESCGTSTSAVSSDNDRLIDDRADTNLDSPPHPAVSWAAVDEIGAELGLPDARELARSAVARWTTPPRYPLSALRSGLTVLAEQPVLLADVRHQIAHPQPEPAAEAWFDAGRIQVGGSLARDLLGLVGGDTAALRRELDAVHGWLALRRLPAGPALAGALRAECTRRADERTRTAARAAERRAAVPRYEGRSAGGEPVPIAIKSTGLAGPGRWTDSTWSTALADWRRNNRDIADWWPHWGPAPGQPGCWISPEIQRKHGFTPASDSAPATSPAVQLAVTTTATATATAEVAR